MRRAITLGVMSLAVVATAGCAVTFAKRSPWDIQQLAELSDQLEQFKTLARLKAEEADELRRAKALLGQRLAGSDASIGYDERGLVTRVLDQVLFDSGKAQLRGTAFGVLDQVAQVLADVANQPVGVEGHTDNQPIQHSGWADNHALSVARANAVADYLLDKGVDGSRLIPVGYGEEYPIASNDTPEGRQKNRRVEIIILPKGQARSYRAEAQAEGRSGGRGYTK